MVVAGSGGMPSVVDVVVERLREVHRQSGLVRTLEIGRVIFEQFFNGSMDEWTDRRKLKAMSIRRVAAHQRCPVSKSAIHQAVRIYVTTLHHPWVQTSGQVYAGHIALITGLRHEHQEHFLKRVAGEGLSVNQLRDLVTHFRRECGESRGRPPLDHEEALVAEVLRACANLERSVNALEWTPERLARHASRLRGVRSILSSLGQKITAGY